MNTEEIRAEILSYFGLAQRIKKFDCMRQTIEKEYYASQSFTGGMMWDLTPTPYHRARSVEHHALTLYDMTSALDKKIAILKDRHKHFQRYLEKINIAELQDNLKSESRTLTEIEKKTYAEIFQIEQYIKFKYKKHLLQYKAEAKPEKDKNLEIKIEKVAESTTIFTEIEDDLSQSEGTKEELEAIRLNLFSKLGSLFE